MPTEQERFNAKAEIAQQLRALKTNSAFQSLKASAEKRRDRRTEVLAKAILAGKVMTKDEVEYERGYWNGVMDVLNRPDNAEKAFDEALKRLEMETNE